MLLTSTLDFADLAPTVDGAAVISHHHPHDAYGPRPFVRADKDSGHTDAFIATELPELGAPCIAGLGACHDERKPGTEGAWPELAQKPNLTRTLSVFPLDGTRPEGSLEAFAP